LEARWPTLTVPILNYCLGPPDAAVWAAPRLAARLLRAVRGLTLAAGAGAAAAPLLSSSSLAPLSPSVSVLSSALLAGASAALSSELSATL
jgi:hypothetical protein